jgi:hypothetical protein
VPIGEQNVDRNLHELSGQPRHPVISAICESLLEDEVLSLDVALFREASAENIEMGAPRTGATDLQPADARNPDRSLCLERGLHGEQVYAEGKNRHPDPHSDPVHLHRMASRPVTGCVSSASIGPAAEPSPQ